MRILVVSTEFPPGPGGIGTHCYELCRGLAQLGWNVCVMTSQDYCSPDEASEFRRNQRFQVIPFSKGPSRLFRAFSRFRVVRASLRDDPPDLVLATGSSAVVLVDWVTRRRPLTWVAVGHGTEFGRASAMERRRVRTAFDNAAAVVCVSHFTQKRMRAFGITPRVVDVIPNGADASRFRPLPDSERRRFRAALGAENSRLLLTVGNVTRRKGQDVVIRALPAIRRRIPDLQYVVAGLPTEKKRLEALARTLGISEHVRFLGPVPPADLVGLYNACDLFVMTSRETAEGDFEGYGIAVVEAALCGKPSVVSRSGGLPEAIVDGETGLAVLEDDPDATAEAALALLSEEFRARRMGEAARARALQDQTWERRVRQYDELLRRLTQPEERGRAVGA